MNARFTINYTNSLINIINFLQRWTKLGIWSWCVHPYLYILFLHLVIDYGIISRECDSPSDTVPFYITYKLHRYFIIWKLICTQPRSDYNDVKFSTYQNCRRTKKHTLHKWTKANPSGPLLLRSFRSWLAFWEGCRNVGEEEKKR